MKKANYLTYIHEFRGLAILLIVASHVFWGLMDENPILAFLNGIVRGSTILFLFISGFLFQFLSGKFHLKTYYIKKFKYVILPYVIVSTPFIFLRLYSSYSEKGSMEVLFAIKQFFAFLMTGGHLLPFWYIPVITIFFLLAPLFIWMDKHPKLYYLIPVLIALSIAFPRNELNNIPRLVVHFFSVYVFGMFFAHYRDRIFEYLVQYKWHLLILTLVVTAISLYPKHGTFYYFAFQYARNMIFCLFFMHLLKHAKTKNNVLSILADISFGIYFVHYPFMMVFKKLLEKFIPYDFTVTTFWWIPLFICGVAFGTIGSVIVIKIVKRITGKYSRLVIGC